MQENRTTRPFTLNGLLIGRGAISEYEHLAPCGTAQSLHLCLHECAHVQVADSGATQTAYAIKNKEQHETRMDFKMRLTLHNGDPSFSGTWQEDELRACLDHLCQLRYL